MNSTVQWLVAARKLIERPENWFSFSYHGQRPEKLFCAFTALRSARLDGFDAYDLIDTTSAPFQYFRLAAGCEDIIAWNDAPERTHAEVLAAFDRAITLAESAR